MKVSLRNLLSFGRIGFVTPTRCFKDGRIWYERPAEGTALGVAIHRLVRRSDCKEPKERRLRRETSVSLCFVIFLQSGARLRRETSVSPPFRYRMG